MAAAPAPTLAMLRAGIDGIDDQILDLIERRLGLGAEVAALKDAQADDRLKLRPARERAVVARLSARARRASPALVSQLWRTLMSHGRQAQAPMEIVVCAPDAAATLVDLVRERFGPAPAIRLTDDPGAAIEAARDSEAIAVIGPDLPLLLEENDRLVPFDRLAMPCGDAVVIGRVAPEEAIALPAPASDWSPASWRSKPVTQMPVYPDAALLRQVEQRVAASRALVQVADIERLKERLATVAAGRAFLLQGGDCAESFAEFGASKVRTAFDLLLRMGAMIGAGGSREIVHLARIAGQFAKPRSSPLETIDGVTLPSYRGDAVNGPGFTAAERTPDSKRLLQAYRQARATIDLVGGLSAASYADIAAIHRELGLAVPDAPVAMFTSHEALLLNYEQALVRTDAATGRSWATSGHMIWLGDRTRMIGGAHVEFARGVGNPIGIKCGPSLESDELLRLIDVLDPANSPGRLVLIGRFGAAAAPAHLARLMRATRAAGRNAIWMIDPMHGNTREAAGRKTRFVDDILAETRAFFAVAAAEGVHAGGLHLEMTGDDVTECLGGGIGEADLGRRYLTQCDPRLNRDQALDVAGAVAAMLGG
jgi:3-deoxy-7-phosphoheptulonate synthase